MCMCVCVCARKKSSPCSKIIKNYLTNEMPGKKYSKLVTIVIEKEISGLKDLDNIVGSFILKKIERKIM